MPSCHPMPRRPRLEWISAVPTDDLWPDAFRSRIIPLVPNRTQESLPQLRARVRRLEMPSRTSPTYSKVGWPLLGAGVLLWIVLLLIPGHHFLLSILALILIGVGVSSVATSFVSAHSEDVEEAERARLIRERDDLERCLYLEGKVPDGKGRVGRCRRYEFDMVDLPYCIYCREYTPSRGEPDV